MGSMLVLWSACQPTETPSADPQPAVGAATSDTSAVHDFDFLIGTWRVHNRRLRARLVGADTWDEFDATMETLPILDGLGNVDRFTTDFFGAPFHGSTLRLFNPATNQWKLYWTDTTDPTLREQVTGRFEGDQGDFFGEEMYQGRLVQLRFRWIKISPNQAKWEQAYLMPDGQTWETNWTMDFARIR